MPVKNEISKLYKLSNGETLRFVAKKFEVSPQILAGENRGIIFCEGATIAIPKNQSASYKVVAGDTIDSICEKFQLSKSEFLEKNGVNFIYHGMIVVI